jgi:hypothetical protein
MSIFSLRLRSSNRPCSIHILIGESRDPFLFTKTEKSLLVRILVTSITKAPSILLLKFRWLLASLSCNLISRSLNKLVSYKLNRALTNNLQLPSSLAIDRFRHFYLKQLVSHKTNCRISRLVSFSRKQLVSILSDKVCLCPNQLAWHYLVEQEWGA